MHWNLDAYLQIHVYVNTPEMRNCVGFYHLMRWGVLLHVPQSDETLQISAMCLSVPLLQMCFTAALLPLSFYFPSHARSDTHARTYTCTHAHTKKCKAYKHTHTLEGAHFTVCVCVESQRSQIVAYMSTLEVILMIAFEVIHMSLLLKWSLCLLFKWTLCLLLKWSFCLLFKYPHVYSWCDPLFWWHPDSIQMLPTLKSR